MVIQKTVQYRQLVFDPDVPHYFRVYTRQEIQAQRLPKPRPLDVFNDADEKLRKIAGLPDPDRYLRPALDAIQYFFYCDKDDRNAFVKNNLHRYRYVDTNKDGYYIHDAVSEWLYEREAWCRLLHMEPLHVCFDEFVRPLREYIAEFFQQIETNRIQENGDECI